MLFIQEGTSLPNPWQDVALHGLLIGSLLLWVPLFRFVYSFPKPIPSQQREAMLAWYIALLLPIIYLIYNLPFLFQNKIINSFYTFDLWIKLLGSWWPAIVLLRRTVYFDAPDASVRQNPAGNSLLRKVLRPQGRDAKAARAFALAFVPISLLAVVAFSSTVVCHCTFVKLANNLLLVSFLILIGPAYIRYGSFSVSFPIKTSGVSWVVSLLTFCFVGFSVAPFLADAYRPAHFVSPESAVHFRSQFGKWL